MKKYCIVYLPNNRFYVCENITSPVTKMIEKLTGTVGTHIYRDILTGIDIYEFPDNEKKSGYLVGNYQYDISEKTVKRYIKKFFDMGEERYYIQSMKDAIKEYVRYENNFASELEYTLRYGRHIR